MPAIQTNSCAGLRSIAVVAVLMASIAGFVGRPAAEEFVTPQRLTDILATRNIDAISRAMNDVKRLRYKGEILPFFAALWALDRKTYPDLPWEVIELPPVRLEVAHVLVQAARNGYIDIDVAPLHDYARLQAREGTPQDTVTAMLTLTTINDPADIPMLREIAVKENRITFRMSVITIAEMCANEQREAALDELASSISNEQNREFLEDYRHKAIKYRRARCYGQ